MKLMWKMQRQLIVQIMAEDLVITNSTYVAQFYVRVTNSSDSRYPTAIENAFFIILLAGFTLSTLCLLVHLYKFLRSDSPQSLPTKNLTFYCFFLLVSFVYDLARVTLRGTCCDFFRFISFYKLLAMPFLKFILTLDVFFCLRSTVLRLERSSGPRNTTFVMYCVLGTGIPLLSVVLLDELLNNSFEVYSVVVKLVIGIRFVRLVLFGCVLRYVRLASFGKSMLLSNVLLHIRLIVVVGALSAVSDVVDLICMMLGYKIELLGRIPQLGNVFEGLVIGVCFTFKKDTFKSTKAG